MVPAGTSTPKAGGTSGWFPAGETGTSLGGLLMK